MRNEPSEISEIERRFDQLLSLEETRVALAKQEERNSARQIELEAQKVQELQIQNELEQRRLEQETAWQTIERERIAQINLQASQIENLSVLMRGMCTDHQEGHHRQTMTWLAELRTKVDLLTDTIIPLLAKESKSREEVTLLQAQLQQFADFLRALMNKDLNINVGGATQIGGDVRAGQDVRLREG